MRTLRLIGIALVAVLIGMTLTCSGKATTGIYIR